MLKLNQDVGLIQALIDELGFNDKIVQRAKDSNIEALYLVTQFGLHPRLFDAFVRMYRSEPQRPTPLYSV